MPTYVITAPDGHEYEVTGEGTEEEALAHFQSTWKPEEAAPAPVAPAPTAPDQSLLDKVVGGAKTATKLQGGVLAGLMKSGVDAAAQSANAHPGAKLLMMLGKTRGMDPVGDAQGAAKREYDKAGPEAFLGKLGGDIALSAGGANAMGNAAGSLVKSKPLAAVVNDAVSGFTGGAVLPPSEDESRARNGLQGAAGAIVLGPLARLAAAGKRGLDNVVRGPEARAGRAMEKAGVDIPKVDAELQNPRTLPMTNAAASGDEAMFGVEKALRREPMKDPGRYAKLDDATNEAAWNKLTGTLDDSVTKLPERQMVKQDAMRGIEQQLDKVKIKGADRDSLDLQLQQLMHGKESQYFVEKGDRKALQDALVAATDPNATYGTLARLHTSLNDSSKYNFTTPGNAQRVRDRVKAFIDSRNNGVWSQAEQQFASAVKPLEESQAANDVISAFQDPISGLPKGKSTTGIPEVTATKLRGSISQHGTDRTDKYVPNDKMNKVDREQLEQLVLDKMKAENVANSKAIPAELPGGRGGALPTSKAQAARTMISNILDTRARGTREAMDRANLTQEGWEKLVKEAAEDKRITARDAAFLASILRGTGGTAGALVTGD